MTVTEASTDSEPEAPIPTLAKLIQVSNIRGVGFQILIDGRPLPYQLAGVRADVGGPYAMVEVSIPCERLELVDEPMPQPAEPEPVDVPPGIAAVVAGIAKTHPAITYHPQDPNAAAIAQAARQHGLARVPDENIQFRTIAGVHGGR